MDWGRLKLKKLFFFFGNSTLPNPIAKEISYLKSMLSETQKKKK